MSSYIYMYVCMFRLHWPSACLFSMIEQSMNTHTLRHIKIKRCQKVRGDNNICAGKDGNCFIGNNVKMWEHKYYVINGYLMRNWACLFIIIIACMCVKLLFCWTIYFNFNYFLLFYLSVRLIEKIYNLTCIPVCRKNRLFDDGWKLTSKGPVWYGFLFIWFKLRFHEPLAHLINHLVLQR